MSFPDNAFGFFPTLKHLGAVKIVSMLLKDSKNGEMMRAASLRVFFLETDEDKSERELLCIFEKIGMKVDKLNVPEKLKDYMKTCLLSMTMSVTHWLACAAENTPLPLQYQYWTETIYELMSHLQWDDFVFVDGWKTLESYVSNRETVNFVIWNQLCFHCMEDEIIRFSKTIGWRRCKKIFDSAYNVYWYWKIYREFPAKEMCQSESYDSLSHIFHSRNELDERAILQMMFINDYFTIIPKTGKIVSGIRYFRNYLHYPRTFELMAAYTNFSEVTDEFILYLLRTINPNTLCTTVHNDHHGVCVIHALVKAPLILFIDNWISVFETLDARSFCFFFHAIGENGRKVMNDRIKMFYEPFEKVWRIFYRRFSSDLEKMTQAFLIIFPRNDFHLSKHMFHDVADNQRKPLLKGVKDYSEKRRLKYNENRQLSLQFSEHVLKDDDERELFSQILDTWVDKIE